MPFLFVARLLSRSAAEFLPYMLKSPSLQAFLPLSVSVSRACRFLFLLRYCAPALLMLCCRTVLRSCCFCYSRCVIVRWPVAAFLAASCSLPRPCCGPWRRAAFFLFMFYRVCLVCECPQSGPQFNTNVNGFGVFFGGFLSRPFYTAALSARSLLPPGWARRQLAVKSKLQIRKDISSVQPGSFPFGSILGTTIFPFTQDVVYFMFLCFVSCLNKLLTTVSPLVRHAFLRIAL